mgnify:CR=1 FL=1
MINLKHINWRKYQGILIPDHPPHIEVDITQRDKKELIKKTKAYLIRWITNWDCSVKTEFWYVIKDTFQGMEELSSNTRSKVRRGMKKCTIKKIPPDILREKGYEVYIKAFDRYETYLKPESKQVFIDDINALDEKKWDFWGVFHEPDQKLIGYSQNLVQNDVCEYKTLKFDPEYMKNYSSYALLYRMNEYYFLNQKLKYVNDGARSISHQTNIQDFLIEKFKFRKAYCLLNIFYRRDIGFFVSILHPFRGLFNRINIQALKKVAVLLIQEEIRRNCQSKKG